MSKFLILKGSIKKSIKTANGSTKRLHKAGDEIELSADEAAEINAKGKLIEPVDVAHARTKASADAKAAIDKAEKDAAAKAAVDAKTKGGGK